MLEVEQYVQRPGAGANLVCFQNSPESLKAGLAAASFTGSNEAGSWLLFSGQGGASDGRGGVDGGKYMCILQRSPLDLPVVTPAGIINDLGLPTPDHPTRPPCSLTSNFTQLLNLRGKITPWKDLILEPHGLGSVMAPAFPPYVTLRK